MDKVFNAIRGWRLNDQTFLVCEYDNQQFVFEDNGDALVQSEIENTDTPIGAQVLTAAAMAPFSKRVLFVARQHKNFKRLFPAATVFVPPPVRTRSPVLQPVATTQAPTPAPRIRAVYATPPNS